MVSLIDLPIQSAGIVTCKVLSEEEDKKITYLSGSIGCPMIAADSTSPLVDVDIPAADSLPAPDPSPPPGPGPPPTPDVDMSESAIVWRPTLDCDEDDCER